MQRLSDLLFDIIDSVRGLSGRARLLLLAPLVGVGAVLLYSSLVGGPATNTPPGKPTPAATDKPSVRFVDDDDCLRSDSGETLRICLPGVLAKATTVKQLEAIDDALQTVQPVAQVGCAEGLLRSAATLKAPSETLLSFINQSKPSACQSAITDAVFQAYASAEGLRGISDLQQSCRTTYSDSIESCASLVGTTLFTVVGSAMESALQACADGAGDVENSSCTDGYLTRSYVEYLPGGLPSERGVYELPPLCRSLEDRVQRSACSISLGSVAVIAYYRSLGMALREAGVGADTKSLDADVSAALKSAVTKLYAVCSDAIDTVACKKGVWGQALRMQDLGLRSLPVRQIVCAPSGDPACIKFTI